MSISKVKSKEISHQIHSPYISIEKFISQMEQIQEVFPTENDQYEIFTPNSYNHAQEIVKIYQSIYKGTYPYKEMLNTKFIYSSFLDGKYWWGMIKNEAEIIGCFTIVKNNHNKSAYMRGLNIKPKFQGLLGGEELCQKLIYSFLIQNPDVNFWYGEARTAHCGSQYISFKIGARSCGLFLGKDYFFKKKESDALMISYRRSHLLYNRIKPKILPKFIESIYNFIKAQYNLKENPIFIESQILLRMTKNLKQEIHFTKKTLPYGYQYLKWENQQTGDYLEGIYTKNVRNIEKIRFYIKNSKYLPSFIEKLMLYIDQYEIEYTEVMIPVNDIISCEFLFHKGWNPIGYIPAWEYHPHSKKYEDVIIFGMIPKNTLIQNMRLIPQIQELYQIIDRFNEQRILI